MLINTNALFLSICWLNIPLCLKIKNLIFILQITIPCQSANEKFSIHDANRVQVTEYILNTLIFPSYFSPTSQPN
jgi:hypothetical protein